MTSIARRRLAFTLRCCLFSISAGAFFIAFALIITPYLATLVRILFSGTKIMIALMGVLILMYWLCAAAQIVVNKIWYLLKWLETGKKPNQEES